MTYLDQIREAHDNIVAAYERQILGAESRERVLRIALTEIIEIGKSTPPLRGAMGKAAIVDGALAQMLGRSMRAIGDAPTDNHTALDALLQQARAEEREACAQIAEAIHIQQSDGVYDIKGPVQVKREIAAAIRARGEAAPFHTCGICGEELQAVRPGKFQCARCESARVVVTGACHLAKCGCANRHGDLASEVGWPPYHDGCTCEVE